MDWTAEFQKLTGHDALLSWQQRLLGDYLQHGECPCFIDLPTGLGKTAVISLWLMAKANGAVLPRRLIYIVDRRAVVDQATEEAEALREKISPDGPSAHLREGLGLAANQQLPVSTIRGQFVDNRAWLLDPANVAIVVGTIDMIGSRLLFEGYGTSRHLRPYLAGLLGVDSLIILDEAHLVPPFAALLNKVVFDEQIRGPVKTIPRSHFVTLSATNPISSKSTFSLIKEDLDDNTVYRRFTARKALNLIDPSAKSMTELSKRLANAAIASTDNEAIKRVVIYCDSRKVALSVETKLRDWATRRKREDIGLQLLVGGRRIRERTRVRDWLERRGFTTNAPSKKSLSFLIATSAGEVGVDFDTDHMVCDLVEWERMVQRFGRVNRRGMYDHARIDVIYDASGKDPARSMRLQASERLIRGLTTLKNGASPENLINAASLAGQDSDAVAMASTPSPLRPSLTRATVDAWSMTSLSRHNGRPDVLPWLRGWEDTNQPRARLVWRKILPIAHSPQNSHKRWCDFFELAAPHVSEQLETEIYYILEWLSARMATVVDRGSLDSQDTVFGVLLGSDQQVVEILTVAELVGKSIGKKNKQLERKLIGRTLVLDASIAGLNNAGLLDTNEHTPPRTIDDDDTWIESLTDTPVIPFRVRVVDKHKPVDARTDSYQSNGWIGWQKLDHFRYGNAGDGTEREILIEKWKSSTSGRVARRSQSLTEHSLWTLAQMEKLVERLPLSDSTKKALKVAARLHDEGKRRAIWQKSVGKSPVEPAADEQWPYAKTDGKASNPRILRIGNQSFRHEFASIVLAKEDDEYQQLDGDLRDLVLHLIAAHHGRARPCIAALDPGVDAAEVQQRATESALRFARQQKIYGPWGLAWMEALLRAADWQASARLDSEKPHID